MSRIAIPVQQVAGRLGGQVTDQKGVAVGGATLSMTRKDGAESRSVTNSKGVYSLDGLAPGSYTLRLGVAGFASYENDQINVQAGSRQTLDIVLHATMEQGSMGLWKPTYGDGAAELSAGGCRLK
jgi:hypothetical protein